MSKGEATGKNLTTIYITCGHGDHVAQGDTAPSTIVHIPDLDAVIAGGVAYNGIQLWPTFTDHDPADKMMAVHGDLGNPGTLWTAAQAVVDHGQGTSS